MDSILCAIDFSPTTARVIGSGAHLAKALGTGLIAFHAVHFASDPLYATDLPDRQARARRLYAAAGGRLTESMAGMDLPWEPVVVEGDPVEQLAQVVAARRPCLVVTASHGIGMLQRLFIGTVVERMVQRIGCPILTLHPTKPFPRRGAISQGRVLVGCDLQPPAVALEAACRLVGHCATEIHLLHVSESPLDPALVNSEHGPGGQGLEDLAPESRPAASVRLPGGPRRGAALRGGYPARRSGRSDTRIRPGASN